MTHPVKVPHPRCPGCHKQLAATPGRPVVVVDDGAVWRRWHLECHDRTKETP